MKGKTVQKKKEQVKVGTSGKSLSVVKGKPEGIKRECSKSGPYCKVTFRLPGKAAEKARKVMLVGDFNNWDTESTPMKKMKNGDFVAVLQIRSGREYRFKYLIDGNRWENDWQADRYDPNPFGTEDSILIL